MGESLRKQGVVVLGVSTALGVGYWLGKSGVLERTFRGKKTAQEEELDEVERLIRPNIRRLLPYRCARDDYDKGILLDANENSLGPSLQEANELNKDSLERYPSPYQTDVKQLLVDYRNAVATKDRVHTDNIFLGVGSDEVIDQLIRVSCTPSVDSVLLTPPTYGMYGVCADTHDVEVISVPLHIEASPENPKGLTLGRPLPAFHIDPHKILAAATPNTKIIFLCSPGNPTASSLRTEDVMTILESPTYKGLVVVDEAYVDFSETSSLCLLVNKYKRLVVVQTFSKAFGLAGIRLGCAFGSKKLIHVLNKVKAPYNISKLTNKVALEALSQIDRVKQKINVIKTERVRVIRELQKLPFVKAVYASNANFVLFETPHALEVYHEMAERGVVVRYRGKEPLLKDCIRATIGQPEENDRMLRLLIEVANELAK